MSNTQPFEVIAAPYVAYFAVVGTAFPNVAVVPGVGWTKIGTSGDLNYDDDAGVTVEHTQQVNPWRALGDCGPRKTFRTTEDQKVRLKLVDITLEQYRLAINNNVVTTVVAGVGLGGYKKIGLSRGFNIVTMALLVRALVSPYGEDWNSQYEVPLAQQTGNPTVIYKKGTPAGLDLEWTSLVDPSAASEDERFGRFIAQNADAGT